MIDSNKTTAGISRAVIGLFKFRDEALIYEQHWEASIIGQCFCCNNTRDYNM